MGLESDWRWDVTAEGFNLWGASKVAFRLGPIPDSWVSDEPSGAPHLYVVYFNVDPRFHPPFGDIYYKAAAVKPAGSFSPFPYGVVTKPDHPP